jgi:hypothetical protein
MANDTQTSTTPAAAVEEKQSIPQKVDALNAAKTVLVSELNHGQTSEARKQAVQQEITVIDRKLRWYAGRSGGSKAVRPSQPKAPRARGTKAAKSETPAQPAAPVAPSANES